MSQRTLRGQVAVVGVGETAYYKHGQAPEAEFTLALQAILARLRGRRHRPPRRSTASPPTATTATIPRAWPPRSACPSCASRTCSGAAAAAAARRRSATPRRRSPPATPTAWSSSARSPRASSSASARRRPAATVAGEPALTFPYGLMSPAQRFAMRVMRFMHDHGIAPGGAAGDRARLLPPRAGQPARRDARAAADRRRPTTPRAGSSSRSGSSTAAWRTTAPPRSSSSPPSARATCAQKPAYLLGVAQGSEYRNAARGHNAPNYATSSFTTVAPHLYEMAGVGAEGRRRRAELRELHRRRADEPRRARLLHRRGGQRLPHAREPDRARRPPAAQHQRRQPRRVLHARPRAADRGGAPAPRRVDQPGARRATSSMVISGPMVTPVSSMHPRRRRTTL